MGLLQRLKRKDDTTDSGNGKVDVFSDEELHLETAKVRAYRTADEMATASQRLMEMALELRGEIEAMTRD